MELKVISDFTYGDTEYSEGQLIELPNSVAQSVIDKGFAKKIDQLDEDENTEIEPLDDTDIDIEVPEDAEEIKSSSDEDVYDDFERFSFEEVGDRIEGKYVDSFEAKFGKGYVIELAKDKARIVYPNDQLEDKLEQIDEGNRVMIVHDEKRDVGKANPMKHYRVYKL